MFLLRAAVLGLKVLATAFLVVAVTAAPPTTVARVNQDPPPNDNDDISGDLLELVEKAVIEALSEGDGIDHVSIKVRLTPKYADRTVIVRIPPGLVFSPEKNKYQPMLNIRAGSVKLRGGGWKRVRLRAVCTDISKEVPGSDQGFQVRKGEGFWAKFAKALAKEAQDYVIEQAATWICGDDADFKKLGELVNGAGERLIGPDEAIRALKLIADIGYDITGRAIFRERAELLRNAKDPQMRDWLSSR